MKFQLYWELNQPMMNTEAKLSRLLFVSPWMLLVFLIVPLVAILSVKFHLSLLTAGFTTLLLANNLCFTFFVACRLARYLFQLTKAIRYGAALRRPRRESTHPLESTEVVAVLSRSGFFFAADNGYGEKRDLGYLGTVIMYAGLFLLLAVGSWDNLQKFSGVLLDGMGPATNLNKLESYRSFVKGPLVASPRSLPQMQINKQHLPDSTYPMGATDVSFLPEDGKEQVKLLKPREPFSFGAYDIYMAKLVFEPEIVIKAKDATVLFDEVVKLDPLVQKRGVYSFYGLFHGVNLGGGVYYQPETSSLMVVITRGDKKVVTDMVFQVDQEVKQGEYTLSCAKMGQWTEIHVVRRRHMGLLLCGAIVMISGLLLRIAIRPQRVWLEKAAAGCKIRTSGREAERLLRLKS